ncbi:hypothetical protein RRG08_009319 [Elysia crispata]|uniref:Uncharacterized protein n=1 Tax=Elysia crispata TaxID=231223 RepID=A0AAE0ZSW5_9GAST|nr:hypothetical protein RRG08_009319 [Elysia crispata]
MTWAPPHQTVQHRSITLPEHPKIEPVTPATGSGTPLPDHVVTSVRKRHRVAPTKYADLKRYVCVTDIFENGKKNKKLTGNQVLNEILVNSDSHEAFSNSD